MTAGSDPQRAGLTNPAPRFSALLGCCSFLTGCRILDVARDSKVCVRTPEFGKSEGRTADPSATPNFLSRVAASVNCMWFSLGRTT
jgi:hypothetical protein